MIDVQLLSENPRVLLVVFAERVLVADAEGDRRFGDFVKTFNGEPFRVLCDFRTLASFEEGVAEAFLRAQSFALKANLERDVFVTSDPAVRTEFNRIAQDTRRFHWLGPLRFFDSFEEAHSFIFR